jgi:hypothetical protein
VTADQVFSEQDYDIVANPSHHTSHQSGVECWDISCHMSGSLAQAFQYVWRLGDKGGVQDLERAIKWIEKELTIEQPIHLKPSLIIDNFNLVLSAEQDAHKSGAMRHIVFANTCALPERRQHLARAIDIIADMVLI